MTALWYIRISIAMNSQQSKPSKSVQCLHRGDGVGSGVGFSLNSSRTSHDVTEIGIREVFVINSKHIQE